MRNILINKWFRFGIVLFVYLLWTYWVGSWWLLILVPVIFDIYITKRVHWAFWKKKGVEKQTNGGVDRRFDFCCRSCDLDPDVLF